MVDGWGLTWQRKWRRQLYEGKDGSKLKKGKLIFTSVITNAQRANNVSYIQLKVISDSKGAGKADI